MPLTFRLATDHDAETIPVMMREYYAYDGHAFHEDHARAALVAFLREPRFGHAWLICDESVPVGYAVLTLGYSLEYLGRDAFLDEFFIRESHRGRGWGRLALEFVEEQARACKVHSIHLEVVRANTSAKEFYRRNGYVDHPHALMSKWIERGLPKSGTH
jgi:GNAT superfamily N-acetyltransferase